MLETRIVMQSTIGLFSNNTVEFKANVSGVSSFEIIYDVCI